MLFMSFDDPLSFIVLIALSFLGIVLLAYLGAWVDKVAETFPEIMRHKLHPQMVNRYYELMANDYAFRYYAWKKGGALSIDLSKPYSIEEIRAKERDKYSKKVPYQVKSEIVKSAKQAQDLFEKDFHRLMNGNVLLSKYYETLGKERKLVGDALRVYCLVNSRGLKAYLETKEEAKEREILATKLYEELKVEYSEGIRLLAEDEWKEYPQTGKDFLGIIALDSRFRNVAWSFEDKLKSFAKQLKELESVYRKYEELKSLYPIGVESYERELKEEEYSRKKKSYFGDITYKRKSEIRRLVVSNESIVIRNHIKDCLDRVTGIQVDFSEKCRMLCESVASNCGCYDYSLSFENISPVSVEAKYEFWHIFYASYSEDPEIVSSDSTRWLEYYNRVVKYLKNELYFNTEAYDTLLRVIERIILGKTEKEQTHILFVEHGEVTAEVNKAHFAYLRGKLDALGVSYDTMGARGYDPVKVCKNYILIDLITSKEVLIGKCSLLLQQRRDTLIGKGNACNILYLSMLKAYAPDEAMAIVREEREEIRNYLQEHKVKYFYHFTARKNLSKIKALGGLYSWGEMERRGELIPVSGGNDTSRKCDVENALDDYVHLSFCSEHPMKERLEFAGNDMVVLKIDITAAMLNGVMFSDMTTMDSKHNRNLGIKGLRGVKIPVTQSKYDDLDSEDLKYYQAEILIPKHVSMKYIIGIDYI